MKFNGISDTCLDCGHKAEGVSLEEGHNRDVGWSSELHCKAQSR